LIKPINLTEKDLDTAEKRSKYTLTVVGLNRIRLSTACLFADVGFKVLGVDTNKHVVNSVRKGECPIWEPKLPELLKSVVRERRLKALDNIREAVSKSHIIKIFTPVLLDEHERLDYTLLETVCKEIGLSMRKYSLIIVESTVAPGTTENILKPILEEASGFEAGEEFGLAYSPFRATTGNAIENLISYPRVVAGINDKSLSSACAVLRTVVRGDLIRVSSIKTAETVKLFENIYRNVNLALVNEFAMLCDEFGVDFTEVKNATYCNLPNPGLIGGNLKRDTLLLIEEAEKLGCKLKLISSALKVNDSIVNHIVKLIRKGLKACRISMRRSRIAVLGISYKADVKEHENSKIKCLIDALISKRTQVSVYDPYYTHGEMKELGYQTEKSLWDTIRNVNCIVIAVGHREFKSIDLRSIKSMVKMPTVIVDVCGVLNAEETEREGFIYLGLGRSKN